MSDIAKICLPLRYRHKKWNGIVIPYGSARLL